MCSSPCRRDGEVEKSALRAVFLFFPEGEKTEMRDGAFLKGKEERVGFRKDFFQNRRRRCNKTIHLIQKVINEAIKLSPL